MPGMDGHRHAVPVRLGQDRRVLPAVLDRRSARRPAAGSFIARSRSARAAVSGCRGSAAIAAASSSAIGQRRPVLGMNRPSARP